MSRLSMWRAGSEGFTAKLIHEDFSLAQNTIFIESCGSSGVPRPVA